MTKPIAQLVITQTPNGSHRYELFAGTTRIWLTHALPTVVGRDGARSRMQRWLAANPHEVRMIGVAPVVKSTPLDEEEIAFWREYELLLGGRLWSLVEQLIGTRKEPNTLAGWAKAFADVGAAMQELDRKAGAA